MNIAPNRLVALLTPLVFAPLAGAISVLVARYGLNIDSGSLQAIFIAGATIAFGKAALWLKGWQAHEMRESEPAGAPSGDADHEPDLQAADAGDPAALDDADIPDPDDDDPDPDDLDLDLELDEPIAAE